ncbi:Short-chain dehydrogenase [Paracoccus halophilus]|uniref:Short-chain dehydrogenase n=1 Tax=Paracoccus halophilus TaxID=376733 RepID=A0A099F3M9_9RHOB|nr:SDR family NAD(P)-dependent oxidoreductase [Paracoccus halophilus]KGJ04836.1 short-chain dehydrogenase [Paracoccus halophilus]SFA51449.1 Short-chain dehydrogenase [Paracoccus halophilus]
MPHLLITGGGRGIGRALAENGLARGWRVTVTLRRGEPPAGAQALFLDVTDRAALDLAAGRTGPVDILINNAGIIGPDRQDPLDMDFDGFAELLQVNTLAPLAVTQAFLPNLRAAGHARVLSISSQMAWMGYAKADRIAYRASKAALNKVMQGLATRLEPEGIAVALVDPGWVRTDMGGAAADLSAQQVAQGILELAEGLTLAGSGRFFRHDGSERPF